MKRRWSHAAQDRRNAFQDLRHPPVRERGGNEGYDLTILKGGIMVEKLNRVRVHELATVVSRIEPIQFVPVHERTRPGLFRPYPAFGWARWNRHWQNMSFG